jgi:hypothetical protein
MTETKVNISESAEKRLRHAWKKLTQQQHYLVPQTPEDFKKLGPVPYFEIRGQWIFAKDFVKKTVSEIADLLRAEMGPDRFATSTIVEIIRGEIGTHFSHQEPSSFEWHRHRILENIRSRDHRRQYLRVVAGLKLKNLNQVSFGSWTICHLSEERAKEFSALGSAAEDWRAHVESVLKDFVGKACIIVESRGDNEQSRLNAERIGRYAVDCLRLLMSMHAAPIGAQHVIGISLDTLRQHKITGCSFDFDTQYHTIRFDSDYPRQNYSLRTENIQKIEEIVGTEQMWSLIEKENRTDLEDSIVTAITWFGEAQQETDGHLAYVKYWTCLEALVTGHEKEQIVSRLKTTIPILVSQGPGEVPSKSRVDKAYDLRSKILHRGSRARLTAPDLNEVCNWAWQCIIVSLNLMSRGYETRQQIEEQARKIASRARQS